MELQYTRSISSSSKPSEIGSYDMQDIDSNMSSDEEGEDLSQNGIYNPNLQIMRNEGIINNNTSNIINGNNIQNNSLIINNSQYQQQQQRQGYDEDVPIQMIDTFWKLSRTIKGILYSYAYFRLSKILLNWISRRYFSQHIDSDGIFTKRWLQGIEQIKTIKHAIFMREFINWGSLFKIQQSVETLILTVFIYNKLK